VRTERFETNFTNLSGQGRLLGQVAGRTGRAVAGWLDDRGPDWKNHVQFVTIGPCAAYRTAVSRALPGAVIVFDHFHLVRLANQTVTKVRQRVTRQVLGRRGTDVPEVTTLARTIEARWPQILAFIDTGITNVGTEGTNRLIKDAARTAFGFRNLDNQRRRVRLHCKRTNDQLAAVRVTRPLNFEEPD
jgi:transposase